MQIFQHSKGLVLAVLVDVEGVLLHTGLQIASFQQFNTVECTDGFIRLSVGLVQLHQLVEDIGTACLQLRQAFHYGNGLIKLVLSKIGGSKRLDVSRIAIVEFHHPTKQGCAHTVLTIEELHIGHLEQGIGVIGIYVQAMLEQVMGLTEIACQLLLNAFLIEI